MDSAHGDAYAEMNENGVTDNDIDTEHNARPNRRTLRKLDFILLPFLALLFLLNSLDKSNVGNAESAGFTHDAGLSAGDLNTSLAFFFAFFVALQPVGAALGRRYGMARWVPACMSLWGLCTILHIWVRRRWQLICLRIAVASLEAGFYPTTVSYLSLFYTRYEFAVRLGFFYGQTAVAGALGGVLSWVVFSHFPKQPSAPELPPSQTVVVRDVSGDSWKAWEVLFLIEGCTTMLVALIGFLWLPHSADSAWFLNTGERKWAEERIRLDRDNATPARRRRASKAPDDHGHDDDETSHRPSISFSSDPENNAEAQAYHRLLDSHDDATARSRQRRISTVSAISVTADAGLTHHDVLSAFLNYKIWHLLVCNILSAIPATAFGVFLPLVIKQLSPSLNLSPAESNLLSAPPFAFGALALLLFTTWSDRSHQRIAPILCALGVLLIGLTITVVSGRENYVLRYISLCILLSGSYIASPLTVAWLTNNTPEPGKRAILLGINGWGNLAGVFSALLFSPADRENGYIRSFTVTLFCVVGAFAGYIAFWVLVVRENKWRVDVTALWSTEEKEREEVLGDMPLPGSASGAQRVLKISRLRRVAERLGLQDGRRGDEKMTFRYGL